MPFTVFTLAMLLICIFCIGKEIFNGFSRGPLRALMSLCVVVLSIICSIFVSRPLSGLLTKIIAENLVNELIISNVPMLADFQSVLEVVSFLLQSILAGFVFALLFPIFKLLANTLVYTIIKHKLKRYDVKLSAKNSKEKLLGALTGGVCGFIIAIALTAPIIGTVHLVSNVVDLVEQVRNTVPEDQELAIPELGPVDQYANDPVGNFCYAIGGELIYRGVAIGEFQGESLRLVDEFDHIEKTGACAIEIIGAFYGEDEGFSFSTSADGLYKEFEKSELLRTVSLEMVSEFSLAWLNGEAFLGAQIPDFNDDFKPMVNELLVVGSGINEYNIMPTLKTLLNVVGVLIECDITADSKTAEVDYYLLAPKLCQALKDNPEMKNARLKLENAAIIAIADWANANLSGVERASMTASIAESTAQIYLDITDPQARLEAVNEELLSQFEELGLTIDPAFSELFANKLVKVAEEKYGQISSQDIETLLDQNRGGMVD